ncbi:hypothetical protein LR69_02696 [Geobacillus sp. BCO2]|nr:hypothetical protein LR69_02696 [Geobacillus sp. BCO2]
MLPLRLFPFLFQMFKTALEIEPLFATARDQLQCLLLVLKLLLSQLLNLFLVPFRRLHFRIQSGSFALCFFEPTDRFGKLRFPFFHFPACMFHALFRFRQGDFLLRDRCLERLFRRLLRLFLRLQPTDVVIDRLQFLGKLLKLPVNGAEAAVQFCHFALIVRLFFIIQSEPLVDPFFLPFELALLVLLSLQGLPKRRNLFLQRGRLRFLLRQLVSFCGNSPLKPSDRFIHFLQFGRKRLKLAVST